MLQPVMVEEVEQVEVELYNNVVEEEVGLKDHGDHHEKEVEVAVSVFQLQVVYWLSQFHHADLQTHK